jgi:hypothetical protein
MGSKSGRRVGLTTLPPSVCRMSENVEPQPLATQRASMACTRITLPFLHKRQHETMFILHHKHVYKHFPITAYTHSLMELSPS